MQRPGQIASHFPSSHFAPRRRQRPHWNGPPLLPPFFITKGSAVKQPLVAIKDINQQEHATLHSVCVLCYRLLKQMVFGSPSFALELTSAIPFMMKQLGYRFHVADTLSQMFTDNTMLIEHVSVPRHMSWDGLCSTDTDNVSVTGIVLQ